MSGLKNTLYFVKYVVITQVYILGSMNGPDPAMVRVQALNN